MKMKKWIAALMSCGMIFSLMACGSGETAQNETTAAGQPETEAETEAEGDSAEIDTEGETGVEAETNAAAADGLTGEFSIMIFHSDDPSATDTSAAYWIMANKFMEENPGVTIHTEYVAHDDYETKLRTLIAGDSLPDVFMTKGDNLPTLVEGDMILPVLDEIKTDQEWYDSYVDGAFDDGTYKGVAYTVPFQMQANTIVVYNEKILKECGYDEYPATYQELLEAIPEIKKAGYVPIALGNSGQWVAEGALFNTFAYRYVDKAWFDGIKSGDGTAKFTDAQFVQALTDFQALAQAGAFNEDMNSIDDAEMTAMYYNGKAASYINGAWAVSDIIKNCPDEIKENTRFCLMPSVDGQPGARENVSAGAGWGYCLNSKLDGENKEAVKAFLKYVTTGEYADVALAQGVFSAAVSQSADDSSLDPIFKEYKDIEATMNFMPIFNVQLPPELISEEWADMQELLIGDITPEDMANRMQEAIEDTYEN